MELPRTQALQLAVQAHHAGNLDEAEKYYRAIINTRDESGPINNSDGDILAVAHNNLGFIQQQKGNLKAAAGSYRQASRIKPDYSEAHNNRGYVLLLLGKIDEAVTSLKRAIELNPDFVGAHNNLGHALRAKSLFKDSAACFEKIAKIQPEDADAHNALGAAFQLAGDLDTAISCFEVATQLDPEFFEAFNNMGVAQLANGLPDLTIENCKQAILLKPDYASAYHNLGHALSSVDRIEEAIEAYQEILSFYPDSPEAHNSLGNIMRAEGRYDEALSYFDRLNQPNIRQILEAKPDESTFWHNTKSQALECLYILGRYEELQQRLEQLVEDGDSNRRVAAISAFINHQLKTKDPHHFCPNPLNFIHIGSLTDHVSDVPGFAEQLLNEGMSEKQIWEPEHGVTHSGYQTPNTIFEAGENCKSLERILRNEIESYLTKFEKEDCDYIKSWPASFNLMGWHVQLLKSGYQRSHIHPSGWLSGVVYLKTLSADSDEGAIEFSLHGYDLPILDNAIPHQIHRPQPGDIVLFPSSLFHSTIPFEKDVDRCVIAFNLVPAMPQDEAT